MLGTQTRGGRLVGADESTQLWLSYKSGYTRRKKKHLNDMQNDKKETTKNEKTSRSKRRISGANVYTHSLSLSLSPAHTLTDLTRYSLSPPPAIYFQLLSISLSLSLSLSHTHTQSTSNSPSHSLPLSNSLSLFLSKSNKHTHTLSLSHNSQL